MLSKLLASLKRTKLPELGALQRDLAAALKEAIEAQDWESVSRVQEMLEESADALETEGD